MKISAKLEAAIAGPGFTLRRGFYTGEPADGLLWISVQANDRVSGKKKERRVGVPLSRFTWVEDAAEVTTLNPRAEINAQMKAIEETKKKGGFLGFGGKS